MNDSNRPTHDPANFSILGCAVIWSYEHEPPVFRGSDPSASCKRCTGMSEGCSKEFRSLVLEDMTVFGDERRIISWNVMSRVVEG